MKAAAFAAATLLAAMPLAAGSVAVAQHAAIATPSPDATRIGLSVLKRGGNAIDAAVAAAEAIGSSGGGFLVYYEAATQSVWTLDFSAATAPGLAEMHERFGSIAMNHVAKNSVARNEAKPLWRAPVKVVFRGYDIYTLPPPSAAGLMIGEELNILSGFDLKSATAPKRVHLLAEAARRAAIDRDRFAADPATLRTPFRDVLSIERANRWRTSIDPQRVTPTIAIPEAGKAAMTSSEAMTNFSIIDAAGNAAAVALITEGTLPQSGRLTTTAAPVIVVRHGRPFLVLGTSGGLAMPNLALHLFLDTALLGQSLPDAVAAPRFDQQATPDDITFEGRKTPPDVIAALRAMGHGMRETPSLGDMYALMSDSQRITAVADPRHGGAAGGY